MGDFSTVVFSNEYDLGTKTLVEASAGTGKTFNIQNVYLRLVVAGNLPVERILVVTFTEAATNELRERLRLILTKCRDHLEHPLPEDDRDRARVTDVLRLPIPDLESDDAGKKEQLSRVRLALMGFDNAAIFTIHGFCNRVLERYAFECGHDPDAELLAVQDEVILETCRDWWRGCTYARKDFTAQLPFFNPREMIKLVGEALKRPDADLRPRKDQCGEWKSVVPEVIKEVKAFLQARKDSGSFPGKLEPNRYAGRFEEALGAKLAGALEAPQRDLLAIRRILDALKNDWNNAGWDEDVPFPEPVNALRGACESAWKEIGSLAGKISWTPDGSLKKTKGAAISVTGVREAVEAHGAAIREWIDEGGVPWKKGKKAPESKTVIDFKSALNALLLSRQEDAKAYIGYIQVLAKTSSPDVIQPNELYVGAVAPALDDSLHKLKKRILAEMVEVVRELKESVRLRVRERSLLTYNGMLDNVQRVLADDKAGPRLLQVLRGEFKAALVDEFQDTDPVQHDIFEKIFNAAGIPLFFVGDPKQAIYGFRGGDVFTYYGAEEDVSPARKHSLGRNFRSEANLVKAVNELFLDKDGDRSFLNDKIKYETALEPNDKLDKPMLTAGDKPDERPLKLWKYMLADDDVPGLGSAFARQLYADLAEEVVRILNPGSGVMLGGQPVKACDIAVLVCTHDEADYIHGELAARGINAVRQSVGNVFDTTEAAEMALVMQAMLTPGNARAVRSALCASIMPCARADVLSFSPKASGSAKSSKDKNSNLPDSLDKWMDEFIEAGARWRRRSFIEAFRYLVGKMRLRAHIVMLEDGVRKLTNVLHMAELAHQAAREQQLSPAGLLRWFVRQVDKDSRDDRDEYEMRLASDDDAVKIMTVFKSKGLEFPIVFVPSMWRRKAEAARASEKTLAYHDGNLLVLDLDKDDEDSRARASRERLEENVRLVYVGVTRAINRAYLFCIDKGEHETYALAGLLERWKAAGESHIELKEKTWPGEQGATSPVTQFNPRGQQPEPGDLKPLGERGESPRVDKKHEHASFSSLAPHERKQGGLDLRDVDGESGQEETAGQAPQKTGIFSIPGGARTGDCFHRIFEIMDFQAKPEEVTRLVDAELDRCRVCRGRTDDEINDKRSAVHKMVNFVLDARLGRNGGEFTLRDVPIAARRSELAFHFSLKQHGDIQKTKIIHDILEKNWKSPSRDDEFLAEFKKHEKELPLGFMTGYIDLIFQHKDKFYVVDWKSNKRRGRVEDFDSAGLKEEMAKHAYYLQYMIYTVALHSFLAQVLQDYRYEKNFGGVYYIFLRGVDGTAGRGVFHDCPPVELISGLARVLAAGTEGKP